MEKKRILICCNRTMNIGGIEKALTTLLKKFDTHRYQILLVVHDANGPFFADLPTENLEVFYTNSIDPKQYLIDDMKHFRIGKVIHGLWNRLLLRLDSDWYARIRYGYRISRRGLKFPGHFDCAISYSTDYSDMSMVLNADADKRVAFVHGDATYHPRAAKINDKLVCGLDMVFSVSYEARDKFLQMHPNYKGRTDVIHNVIMQDVIRSKALDAPEGMIADGTFSICTAARVSPEKGQYLIPGIARRLRDDGHKFRWYLVGDGVDRARVEDEIRLHNVEECVILLGAKKNPYPYIKNCDLYVHTSFHEAYCTAIAEARILCRPIVATDATGNREQFRGDDGLIVSQNPDAIYEGVRKLLSDNQLRYRFSQKQEQVEVFVEYDLPKLYQYIAE